MGEIEKKRCCLQCQGHELLKKSTLDQWLPIFQPDRKDFSLTSEYEKKLSSFVTAIKSSFFLLPDTFFYKDVISDLGMILQPSDFLNQYPYDFIVLIGSIRKEFYSFLSTLNWIKIVTLVTTKNRFSTSTLCWKWQINHHIQIQLRDLDSYTVPN